MYLGLMKLTSMKQPESLNSIELHAWVMQGHSRCLALE